MRVGFRLPSLRRAALLAAVALLSACSGGGTQMSPGAAVTTQSLSRASTKHVEKPAAIERNPAIAGPVFRGGSGSGSVSPDGGTIVYNSIDDVNAKGAVGSDIASLGFECCSTNEWGDGVILTQGGGRLKTVTVVMDSWACQTGGVYQLNCLTTPGAKFQWPVTLNIYNLGTDPVTGAPAPTTLIATHTQTFDMPYRPSANNKVCQGPNAGKFLDKVSKKCVHGLAFPITFRMNVPIVTLPAQAVVTVAFNTSTWGYNPAGPYTSCYQAGNCPYDSLNVSAWGNGALQNQGGNVDPNGTFWNVNSQNSAYFYYTPNPWYVNPPYQPPGNTLALDTAGDPVPPQYDDWYGYHPEMEITAY